MSFVVALGVAGPVVYLVGLPCALTVERLVGQRPVLAGAMLTVLGGALGAAAGVVLDLWPWIATVHGAAGAWLSWTASRRRAVGRAGWVVALLVPMASVANLAVVATSGSPDSPV